MCAVPRPVRRVGVRARGSPADRPIGTGVPAGTTTQHADACQRRSALITRCATAPAWTRLETRSLRRTFETWTLAVFSLM